MHYDRSTLRGKGLTIAVFDTNATGSLAPFNGMFIAGIHEEDPNIKGATFTLWKWEGAIGSRNSTGVAGATSALIQGETSVNSTNNNTITTRAYDLSGPTSSTPLTAPY